MPCVRSSRARAARPASLRRQQPGVAEGAEVLARKERKAPDRIRAPPTGRDLYVEPIACAASSITGMPARDAASRIGSMSALRPNRCTGMIAFVRGVIARATAAGSTLKVAGSMSTSTGRAPTRTPRPRWRRTNTSTSPPRHRGRCRASSAPAGPHPCPTTRPRHAPRRAASRARSRARRSRAP